NTNFLHTTVAHPLFHWHPDQKIPTTQTHKPTLIHNTKHPTPQNQPRITAEKRGEPESPPESGRESGSRATKHKDPAKAGSSLACQARII
ncbi:hypothetical protein, partial [Gemmobacter lanyuensis]|uniref:hypothetical protein n=1 Tax=Gemmobacter lanyuensis TaxID=1054497 RepID=UPI001E5E760A